MAPTLSSTGADFGSHLPCYQRDVVHHFEHHKLGALARVSRYGSVEMLHITSGIMVNVQILPEALPISTRVALDHIN